MECLPKIVSSISLQGHENLFDDFNDSDGGRTESSHQGAQNHGNVSSNAEKEKEDNTHEKKRIKPTALDSVKHAKESRPSSSTISNNEEDENQIAFEDSLRKTKDLFDKLVRVCQDQDNSETMLKVVDKLGREYAKTSQEYLGSEQFQKLIQTETEKVKTADKVPWTNLLLVQKEMKHNRKTASKPKSAEQAGHQDSQGSDDERIIHDPKKRKRLKKLEKTLRAINKKILLLEEAEVDLSDDDSTYVKLDRYRTRFTAIYKKVCELKGKLDDAERVYLRKVSFAGSSCSGQPHIVRCIERYYNKHRDFPDFLDVKELIIKANEQENIQMPPIKVHSIAETCFKEFGEMLKRLRQHDDYLIAASYLPEQSDPAKDDPELQEKLHKNFQQRRNVQEIIDEFAKRQDGLEPEDDKQKEDNCSKLKKRLRISQKPECENKNEDCSNDGSESDVDSDDTDYENERMSLKRNNRISSSSDDESGSELPKMKVNKGKSLIGKKRIVKGGSKKNKNIIRATHTLSSDEGSEPKNTKDNLTDYLGLQSNQRTGELVEAGETSDKKDVVPTTSDNKESSSKDESGNKDEKLSPSNSLLKSESTYGESGSQEKVLRKKVKCSSSDSDSDSFVKMAKKRKGVKNGQRKGEKISIYSNSETSDCSSDNEKKNADKCVEISDLELSEDSSGNGKVNNIQEVECDGDEPIILSEEVTVPEEKEPKKVNPARRRRSKGSSESDIIILSQDSDVSNEPVSKKIQPTPQPKLKPSSVCLSARKSTNPPPAQNIKPMMKRKVTSQSSLGHVNKQRRIVGYPNGSMRTIQTTLPRLPLRKLVNGTARKTFGNAPPPRNIPIIELD